MGDAPARSAPSPGSRRGGQCVVSSFGQIHHGLLLAELRRRVTDKRVLGLVRQFLAAGVMREHGSPTATPSGTPQGGILSPLLANVALSVLDRRFEAAWNALTPHQRKWRMAKGEPSYRLVRYADDFVVLVRGSESQAKALKERTAEFMAEQMRLTLSPEKTRITHVDDGFDFLGFRVQRRPRPGRLPVAYSFPSEQSFREVKRRIKELTGRATIGLSLDQLVHALNPILRGWTNYHRHAASKHCFSYLDHYLWWRIVLWLRKKHPRLTWKQIKRRYWGRNWTSPDGTRLYWPSRVRVTRYRYRGHRIPTPWATLDQPPATSRSEASPA
ncbi:MAG: group II intron maturase-specific domain-containing protein [Thermoleophilaceae bacterium]